jgi:hypothetical protein
VPVERVMHTLVPGRRSTTVSASFVAVAVVLGLAIIATASGCREKSHASQPQEAAKAARSCTARTVRPDADAREGFVFQPAGSVAEGVIRFQNVTQTACDLGARPLVLFLPSEPGGAPRQAQRRGRLPGGQVVVRRLQAHATAVLRIEWSNRRRIR